MKKKWPYPSTLDTGLGHGLLPQPLHYQLVRAGCVRDPHAENSSHWCGSWCGILRTYLWLVHEFSNKSPTRTKGSNHLWSLGDSLVLSNIIKKSRKYFTLVVFICTASYNNGIFPLIGLFYWKLTLLTPKTSYKSQGKACRCRKLQQDTQRVFLHMQARTCQCEHSLFLVICEHSVRACVNASLLLVSCWRSSGIVYL